MRWIGALSVAALASCEASEGPRAKLAELPILDGSRACDSQWSDNGPRFVCRGFETDHADLVLAYEAKLGEQGWRMVSPGHGEGSLPQSWEHTWRPIWFERRIDHNCSELLSLYALPTQESPQTVGISLVFVSNYEPVCGAQRQAA